MKNVEIFYLTAELIIKLSSRRQSCIESGINSYGTDLYLSGKLIYDKEGSANSWAKYIFN